jgi:putative transcriptional regulator
MKRIPTGKNDPFSQDGKSHEERVSLAGCLLAAHADMDNPMFSKGVCLIVEHTEKGTVGIMLNRPLAIDPTPVWKTLLQGEVSESSELVGHFNFGGPENGPIVAIHNDSQLADGGNSQGVYVSAQAESLQKLATTAPEHLRWFIGHAEWGKSELEREIVDGKWYVVPAIPQIVFAEESQMWPTAIRFEANSVISTFPGVDHFPPSPSMN